MRAFECRMCGACCYGEGGIYFSIEEKEKMAGYLDMPAEAFLKKYTEERNGRSYLKTGPDRRCIFYHRKKRCLIHPVKPARCLLWPYYPAIVREKENWEMAKDACPGINPECSFEQFVKESGK
jgi:Fe-S-cluster containining protein